MYYTEPASARRRARWPLAVLALVLLLAAVTVAGLLAGRKHPAAKGGTPAPTSTASTAWADIRYVQFEGYTVPVSTAHGPKDSAAGLASGYSHDSEGLVLAASNTFARLASTSKQVYEPTIDRQTVAGGITKPQLIAELARGGSPATDDGFSVVGYLVSGDASGADASVTLLMRIQFHGTQEGQYRLGTQTVHLRWVSGDWRVVLQNNTGGQVQTAPSGVTALPGQTLTATP